MIPKSALNNNEAEKEIDKIKEIENSIDREKLIYKSNKYIHDFRNFQTIRTFGEDIYEGEITFEEAADDQSDLLNSIRDFKNKKWPQNNTKNQEKEIILENLYNFFEGREKVLNGFKSKIFLTKSKGSGILNNNNRSKLKILTPKQMFQRLPIALAQVKAGNNWENLLNEIRQIAYSLYQSKQITKKVYNNIIKSI